MPDISDYEIPKALKIQVNKPTVNKVNQPTVVHTPSYSKKSK